VPNLFFSFRPSAFHRFLMGMLFVGIFLGSLSLAVAGYAAGALALALIVTLWVLVRQRQLRQRIAHQGEGTAFHLCLPVPSRPAPAGSLHPDGAALPAVSAKPRKLLLAEDEEPVSRIVTALLRREGHTVVLATDGHNAWQQLSAAPAEFDAVIMDLNMPGLSGLELASRARALPYDRPLVVMSGRVTEEERLELARLRIDAIINKPFTLEMLHAMLDSVLADPPPPRS
jgi:CheY-like chemotaxis protein